MKASTKRNKLITQVVFVILGIVAVVVIWLLVRPGGSVTPTGETAVVAPTADPIDVVLDWYNDWLRAEQTTTTNPYDAGLAAVAPLSSGLQQYLNSSREAERSVVHCQNEPPPRVGGKLLFATDEAAEVQVLSRGLPEKSPHFAVVRLAAVDGLWEIAEISCASGESAPEREFSFEQSGQLLKSVPPPLDPNQWHLVVQVPGQSPSVVPLFFDAASVCTDGDGVEVVCDPDSLREASRATVQGDMTEAGATVRRLTQ
jgi:hypothetical protein